MRHRGPGLVVAAASPWRPPAPEAVVGPALGVEVDGPALMAAQESARQPVAEVRLQPQPRDVPLGSSE